MLKKEKCAGIVELHKMIYEADNDCKVRKIVEDNILKYTQGKTIEDQKSYMILAKQSLLHIVLNVCDEEKKIYSDIRKELKNKISLL